MFRFFPSVVSVQSYISDSSRLSPSRTIRYASGFWERPLGMQRIFIISKFVIHPRPPEPQIYPLRTVRHCTGIQECGIQNSQCWYMLYFHLLQVHILVLHFGYAGFHFSNLTVPVRGRFCRPTTFTLWWILTTIAVYKLYSSSYITFSSPELRYADNFQPSISPLPF